MSKYVPAADASKGFMEMQTHGDAVKILGRRCLWEVARLIILAYSISIDSLVSASFS